ncbi:MAG: hypothetical protein ACLF0P_11270 [Thermoanaerobaculia bacterium]
MTRRAEEELLRAWGDAEARDDDGAAEAALGALFRSVPLEAPSPGFAARTAALARARRAAAAAEAPAPVPAGTRWAAAILGLLSAGTLALASLAVTILPRVESPALLNWGGAVRAFHRVLVATWEWIASGLALWSRAAEWSAALVQVLSVPEVAVALLASALAAALALSGLRRILAHERELIHAEPT